MSDLCTPGEEYDSLERWWVVEEIFNESGDVGCRLQSYAAKLILGRERGGAKSGRERERGGRGEREGEREGEGERGRGRERKGEGGQKNQIMRSYKII